MKSRKNKGNAVILIVMAFSGAAALIYEVVASDALLNFFGASTYSVATVLISFLFGLALGSLIMSKYLGKIKNKRGVFVVIEIVIAAYALVFLTKLNVLPSYVVNSQLSGYGLLLAKFGVSFVYLLVPTLLLGALFPLASGLMIKDVKKAGSTVGILYSSDTFGAIVGAFLAGFVLLPIYGLTKGAMFGSLLSFFAGLLIIDKKWKKVLVYVFVYLIIFLIVILSGDFGIQSMNISGNVIVDDNSEFGQIKVVEKDGLNTLYIGERYQCDGKYVRGKEIVDSALSSGSEEVLLIGLGCGISLREVLDYGNVKRVDVVEINSKIPHLAKKYFSDINEEALEDIRVNIVVEDGIRYLSNSEKKFDSIVVDLESPVVAHSSPLYTVEFFKKARDLLNPGGRFAIQGYNGDYEYIKILYFSMKEAFPYVYVKNEYMYVGSKEVLDSDLKIEEFELLKKLNEESTYRLNTLEHKILIQYSDGLPGGAV
ncbi:MAG: fused MFS/spermidine synthase [archaeon]